MGNPTHPNTLTQDARIRWVPGFEGHYAATDSGEIWSYKRKPVRLRPMKVGANREYEIVCLWLNGGETRKLVHHCVLEAFKGQAPDGLECRHINGTPDDNRLSNLEWGTKKDNMHDQYRHGTRARGVRHGQAKLNPQKVRQIRERFNEGETPKALACEYGVTEGAIRAAVDRRTWNHVD